MFIIKWRRYFHYYQINIYKEYVFKLNQRLLKCDTSMNVRNLIRLFMGTKRIENRISKKFKLVCIAIDVIQITFYQ